MVRRLPVVKGAHNCKWADPTLFEPAPDWMDSDDKPWTCHRDSVPKHLLTTEVCEDCPRWEERDGAASDPTPKP